MKLIYPLLNDVLQRRRFWDSLDRQMSYGSTRLRLHVRTSQALQDQLRPLDELVRIDLNLDETIGDQLGPLSGDAQVDLVLTIEDAP